ncbi:hypothetical protein CROQUDRAFT_89362 [Cronartium quercuum f. sp. fusiforme G11]|uniref:Uncharacterized protein n=1 Tax=Cronartium quercuum f. sp. fusiforme G11 TaxID=708437 RepID=A0A9P6TF17_9BASI|nr:hypothetical protein CROQUDRAFT_89362 [Cronartium quercuum f. sp. fusiforme G11]
MYQIFVQQSDIPRFASIFCPSQLLEASAEREIRAILPKLILSQVELRVRTSVQPFVNILQGSSGRLLVLNRTICAPIMKGLVASKERKPEDSSAIAFTRSKRPINAQEEFHRILTENRSKLCLFVALTAESRSSFSTSPSHLQIYNSKPFIALRISTMPPNPLPSSHTNRYHPTGSRPDAARARKPPPATMEDANESMTLDDETISLAQRPHTMTMPQMWKQLVAEKRSNGDVVVPAKLVNIISALMSSMEDTVQRMNAMETQLKASHQAMKRLNKIEASLDAPTRVGIAPQTQNNAPRSLPPNPRSWAATVQVVIRSVEGRKPFAGVPPTEIVRRVNLALEKVNAMVLNKRIEVKGAASLPSGCVKFFTATHLEANWLLEH